MRYPRTAFRPGLLALAAVLATGCGTGGEAPPAARATADVAGTVRAATEFGGIVLPANSPVLGARSEHGRDTLYRLALSTDPGGLALLLSASRFAAPLSPVSEVAERTVAGPPPDTSPSLLRGQDLHHRPDGTVIHRIVVVDERDAATRIVHLQLFDT